MILTQNEALNEATTIEQVMDIKETYMTLFDIDYHKKLNMENDLLDYLRVGTWNTNFQLLQEIKQGEQRTLSFIDLYTMTQIELKAEIGFFWLNDDKIIETVGQFVEDLARKNIRIFLYSEVN